MRAVPMAVGMIALLSVTQTVFGASGGPSPWDASMDAVTQTRFIPVELWTGSAWDGGRELKMSKAELPFGERQNKDIQGPMEWRHPVAGETLLVYERTNRQRGGVKAQLFAITSDRSGLGRVLDMRDDLGGRTFPAVSSFRSATGSKAKPDKSPKPVTRDRGWTRGSSRSRSSGWISPIGGTAHCLEFEWLYKEPKRAKVIDQQTSAYCPRQGMVRQVKH